MKNNKKKGFTIVELVIVIAVIGILAGVLIPTFAGVSRKARNSAALQEVTAAHTTILAEEEANLTGDAYYFIIFDKDGEVEYLYTLDENGKPKSIDAETDLAVDKNDVVYTAVDDSVTLTIDPVDLKEYAELTDADKENEVEYYTHVEHEDLNKVVVLVKRA